MKPIPFFSLKIDNEDKKSIIKALDKNWLSMGSQTLIFEKKFSRLINTNKNNCVATSSCTASLHMALLSLNLKKDDEVITVANSYLSTVSSIIAAGATPVLSDVNETLNICPIDLEKKITKKTKVILPVHLTGNPSDMIAIKKIAKKYKLKIIEDCAQAIGASINKKKVGNFGELGCFSFHP